MAVMKASEFVAKLKDVAQNYKTLYVMGCFGAPLTGGNVSRYCNNHAYNKQAARTKMIKAAANQNPPVFGFDCVCLIKGILWGWRGDASKTYGGASYAVNGVPDIRMNVPVVAVASPVAVAVVWLFCVGTKQRYDLVGNQGNSSGRIARMVFVCHFENDIITQERPINRLYGHFKGCSHAKRA